MNRSTQYLCGLILGVSCVLSALPGHAQEPTRVKVNIPFDFVVGDKQLTAGDYVIDSVLDGRVMMLRNKHGVVQQIAFAVPVETKKTGNHERVLFRHDGDRYFLSQIWFSGDDNGEELIQGTHHGQDRPVSNQIIAGQ